MNEKIRLLWRQAVLNNAKTSTNFQDVADEFAQLLIEECELALWSEACMVSDLAYQEYCSNCRKIQEHFKVNNYENI